MSFLSFYIFKNNTYQNKKMSDGPHFCLKRKNIKIAVKHNSKLKTEIENFGIIITVFYLLQTSRSIHVVVSEMIKVTGAG